VTGLDVVTPIGVELAEFWKAALAGVSGVRRIARHASPIAWAEEVHAVWTVTVGPSTPKYAASREARYWGHIR